MNPGNHYHSSVPVFMRYLEGLDRILQTIEQLSIDQQKAILAARLAPDMLDFVHQVEIAIQFSLRILMPIVEQEIPDFSISENIPTLRKKIENRISIINQLSPDAFSETTRTFTNKAGNGIFELSMSEFIHEFGIPNFLFHISMAYAIARANGVSIGKGTYDGFHVYSAGYRLPMLETSSVSIEPDL